MPEDLGQLYNKARSAYRSGDRGKAAYLIDQILKQDYNHRGAWKLLHREYGGKQPLKEFQLEFTEQYYPDKLDLLFGESSPTKQDDLKVERKGLFAWLAAVLKRSAHPSETPSAAEQQSNVTGTPLPVPAQTKNSSETPTRPILATEQEAVWALSQPVVTPPPAVKKDQLLTEANPIEKPVGVVKLVTSLPASQSQSPEKAAKIRVLIVDDTPQTRDTILRSLSFEREIEVVATAATGSQAVQLAKQTKPDVVLMDINMPDMDGITATAAILTEVPFTQIVILTVQNDADYIRRAMLAGARDFITKPPGLDDLLHAVLQAGKIAHQEKRKTGGESLNRASLTPQLSLPGARSSRYTVRKGEVAARWLLQTWLLPCTMTRRTLSWWTPICSMGICQIC